MQRNGVVFPKSETRTAAKEPGRASLDQRRELSYQLEGYARDHGRASATFTHPSGPPVLITESPRWSASICSKASINWLL